MFYTRINKIKVFDGWEKFSGLFNRSVEMRIYNYFFLCLSLQERRTESEVTEVAEIDKSVTFLVEQEKQSKHIFKITSSNFFPPLWGVAEERGGYFCNIFEDANRDSTWYMCLNEIKRIRMPHETAIPTSVYKVIATLSPAKTRMSSCLSDIPCFSRMPIHRGNTKCDSSNCTIVGENKIKDKVVNSTYYEQCLVKILIETWKRSEGLRSQNVDCHVHLNSMVFKSQSKPNSQMTVPRFLYACRKDRKFNNNTLM
jgi:hypothetical protein